MQKLAVELYKPGGWPAVLILVLVLFSAQLAVIWIVVDALTGFTGWKFGLTVFAFWIVWVLVLGALRDKQK